MARTHCWSVTDGSTSHHLAIRHSVFVAEQRLMVMTDVDDWDRDPNTIHVLASRGQEIAGTVRVYHLGDGRWKGDRLAVLKGHRVSSVGADLVRYAVATAAEAGGSQMEATVQSQNSRFFERLGWNRNGEAGLYYGVSHQPMIIGLSNVAPIAAEPPDDAMFHLKAEDLSEHPLLCA